MTDIILVDISDTRNTHSEAFIMVVILSFAAFVYGCEFDFSKIINTADELHGSLKQMGGSLKELMGYAAIYVGVMVACTVLIVIRYKTWKQKQNTWQNPKNDEGKIIMKQILEKCNQGKWATENKIKCW